MTLDHVQTERSETMTERLVCPNCGSDRIGTREKAEIWQRAEFTLDSDGTFETSEGEKAEVEWDAYDSDDVGDTETVGYFCAECCGTWDDTGTIPFVPASKVAAERAW